MHTVHMLIINERFLYLYMCRLVSQIVLSSFMRIFFVEVHVQRE